MIAEGDRKLHQLIGARHILDEGDRPDANINLTQKLH
jgi:hypothetical protein